MIILWTIEDNGPDFKNVFLTRTGKVLLAEGFTDDRSLHHRGITQVPP